LLVFPKNLRDNANPLKKLGACSVQHAQLLLILACVFGFFMAWGIGANDVANAVGTSVGSKALSIRNAIIIAAIFESLGAILAGGQVADTIRSGIIDPSMFSANPEVLVYGMLASLLAAGTWLLLASCFGWPVSTTHSIVGAIIGFGLLKLGADAVAWNVVGQIVASWVITPVVAGIIGYLCFASLMRLILNKSDPLKYAKRYLPYYIFFIALVISLVTVLKGLKHLNLMLDFKLSVILSIGVSLFVMFVGTISLRHLNQRDIIGLKKRKQLERIFAVLLVFSACATAFAHGSNDIANAIGPLAAIVNIVRSGGDVTANYPLPIWILFFGAVGVLTGLATYGYKVIATIGTGITELTPSRGFAASLATASTVVIASGIGVPISTTHTLVGAILGVGFARGIYAINLSMIRNIFVSWLITIPAGAIFAMVYYRIISGLFAFF